MKKIIVYTGFCFALIMCMNTGQAQVGEVSMRIGYNTGMPAGSFKDFMGKNSFRGYFGEVTYGISDQLRVGIGVQNNDYYQKFPRQVYETKDGTVSAVVTNSIQTTPLLLKANYELTKKSLVRPYVGLGAGFNLISFSQYMGQYNQSKSAFKPAVAAEAGVNIPFNKITRAAGISAGLHYDYLPFNYNGVKNLNNWGAHVGVFFPLG
ncbi:MAG: outer membrane beta-barrel protein [Chitinophagaceae bacterium]|nr:outer membrane beta-barrel protein [Chitinophagaceae bacterium]